MLYQLYELNRNAAQPLNFFAQALQSAKLIPLIMLGVLVMMASDPATTESFRTGTVQIVIAIAMGVMLLGFLQMCKDIRRVV